MFKAKSIQFSNLSLAVSEYIIPYIPYIIPNTIKCNHDYDCELSSPSKIPIRTNGNLFILGIGHISHNCDNSIGFDQLVSFCF